MKNKISTVAGILLVTAPVAIYFYIVWKYAINIPFWDEYACGLAWIERFRQASFPDQFYLMFRQTHEHRVFSYYLTLLADYKLFGELNFRIIIITGNLVMTGLLFVLYKMKQFERNEILLFAPVLLLLLIPRHEITDWGIVMISSSGQYLLAFSSMLLLTKMSPRSFFAAIILAIIATFSFGNGMFVFICGFIILLQKDHFSIKKSVIWAVAMVISVLLYFTDYNFNAGRHPKAEMLHHPFMFIQYILVFVGNVLSPVMKGHIILVTLAGLLILVYLSYLLSFKWNTIKQQYLALSCLGFIFLSVVASAVSRVGAGLQPASSGRYSLIPALFAAILYIITINIYKRRNNWIIYGFIAFLVVLYGFGLKNNVDRLESHKYQLADGLLSFYVDPTNAMLVGPRKAEARKLLSTAIKAGYYDPPPISEIFPEVCLKEDLAVIPETNDILLCFDTIINRTDFANFKGWAFIKKNDLRQFQTCAVLKSPVKYYIFSAYSVLRQDVAGYFKAEYPDIPINCGFNFIMDKRKFNLPPGIYQTGICFLENEKMVALTMSDRTLIIDRNVFPNGK